MGDAVRGDKLDMLDPSTGEFKRTGIKRLTPYRLIYLVKRSRLFTLVDWRLRILHSGGAVDDLTSVLEGRTPARYEEGWRLIEASLTRAKDLASQRGFRLIVFPVPAAQEFRGKYPNEQYRSRVMDVASHVGVEHFDPTPRLKADGGGFERYFIMWDGHISASTHGVIAKILADMVETPPTAIIPRQTTETK